MAVKKNMGELYHNIWPGLYEECTLKNNFLIMYLSYSQIFMNVQIKAMYINF